MEWAYKINEIIDTLSVAREYLESQTPADTVAITHLEGKIDVLRAAQAAANTNSALLGSVSQYQENLIGQISTAFENEVRGGASTGAITESANKLCDIVPWPP